MKTETLYYQEWEPSTLLGTCCSIQIWLDKVKYCKSRELLVTLNTITTYLMQPKQSYSEPPPPPPGSMLCGRSARDGRVPTLKRGGGGHKSIYIWAKGECSIIYCQPSGEKKDNLHIFPIACSFWKFVVLVGKNSISLRHLRPRVKSMGHDRKCPSIFLYKLEIVSLLIWRFFRFTLLGSCQVILRTTKWQWDMEFFP